MIILHPPKNEQFNNLSINDIFLNNGRIFSKSKINALHKVNVIPADANKNKIRSDNDNILYVT
jgi:hypothetical protein